MNQKFGTAMQRLQKILKAAFSHKASRVHLEVGSVPNMTVEDEKKDMQGEQPFDEAGLLELYNFLFPQDRPIQQDQRKKGVLKITGLGMINLIADPTPPKSLSLFIPPDGDKKFAQEWDKSQQPKQKQPPPLQKPTPPKPEANVGFIPDLAQTHAVSTATNLAPALQSQPDHLALLEKTPTPPQFPDLAAVDDELLIDHLPKNQTIQETDPNPTIDFSNGPAGAKGAASSGNNPIDDILTDMIEKGASDLHLTIGQPVCYRIDGDIVRLETELMSPSMMENYLLPIIPDTNLTEFAETNDTDFAYEITGIGRFRVNMFRDRNGVGSVMRHIPSNILTADQLGLPQIIRKFCDLHKGLVLVTGPTGSGKSTTLAAMLDLINKARSDHLLTIEDPIEFVHPQQKCLVNQREINKHTTSFSKALRAALREDPDIVLIGEMRDLETVAIAIETAETGHLVFGTLHTTTAISTVDRIVDQFPADQQEQIRMMLASSLKGVVAQTLLKKIGGGRCAAQEILVVNDAVSAMIREGKTHMISNHMQSQKSQGNQLLNVALIDHVIENRVDIQEAYLKAIDKKSFLDLARRKGLTLPGEQRKHAVIEVNPPK